ncbi:MAG: hypothetical protein ACSLE2_12790 [Lysobacterales bacterium]
MSEKKSFDELGPDVLLRLHAKLATGTGTLEDRRDFRDAAAYAAETELANLLPLLARDLGGVELDEAQRLAYVLVAAGQRIIALAEAADAWDRDARVREISGAKARTA